MNLKRIASFFLQKMQKSDFFVPRAAQNCDFGVFDGEYYFWVEGEPLLIQTREKLVFSRTHVYNERRR